MEDKQVHVQAPGYEKSLLDTPDPAQPAVIDRRPIRRKFETLGRNGPCICGSGKKFKRCCLRVSGEPATVRLGK